LLIIRIFVGLLFETMLFRKFTARLEGFLKNEPNKIGNYILVETKPSLNC
jgi:hypothetical protein